MVKLTRAEGQQLSDIHHNRKKPWGKKLQMSRPSNKLKVVIDPGGFKAERLRNGILLRLEYGNKEVLFTDEPDRNADKLKSLLAERIIGLPPSSRGHAMGEKAVSDFFSSRYTGIGFTVWVRANLEALNAHVKECLDVAHVNNTENLRRIDETSRQVDTHQGLLETNSRRIDETSQRVDTHQGCLETFAEDNARDREERKAEREANDAKFFGMLNTVSTHTHQIGQLQEDNSTHMHQISQLQERLTKLEANGPSGGTAAHPAPNGPAGGTAAHPAALAPSTVAAAAPVARAPLPFGIPAKHRTFEGFN